MKRLVVGSISNLPSGISSEARLSSDGVADSRGIDVERDDDVAGS
jgi:hypothetical protein